MESEKGRGSKFTITVTLQKYQGDGSEHDALCAQKEKPRAELAGRTILLAEDVPVNAEIMALVLSMREMKAEHAEPAGGHERAPEQARTAGCPV